MLCQLLCLDRRYQRMNCFNVRELQALLKNRFFNELVSSKDHHEFLGQTAIGIREKLSVFGNDYPTYDGTCIRDYIDVVDLSKAHVIAMKKSTEKNLRAEPVNLGTGTGYSVKQVLEAFETENDIKINTHYGNRRKGDVEAIYADPSYAEELFGWKANLGLKDMVTSVWKWQKAISSKCCGGGCCGHKNKKL